MFGHNLPDTLFDQLAQMPRAYIDNDGGKPVVATAASARTVAVVLRKADNEVEHLSDAERAEMNALHKPFVLVGSSKYISEAYMPDRYTEHHPYLNRPFLHGVFDCYTLIRDFFRREFGMWLPVNIHRPFGWWEQGDNLYVDGAGQHNFRAVQDIRRFDVIVMKMGPVPNHGAIAMGNGKILHHLGGRFSCFDTLSPMLKQSIAVVYRSPAVEQALQQGGERLIEGENG